MRSYPVALVLLALLIQPALAADFPGRPTPAPGSPGTATPQPYGQPTVRPLGAPDRPPLLNDQRGLPPRLQERVPIGTPDRPIPALEREHEERQRGQSLGDEAR
ncbi:hypothetical protein IB229_02930 [Pseudomonas sp. PDM14]|uniref:hypothetical protein n=1 Tax=Pseudomonas sp. PDM14 TaxID=2769288 RepID=UPI0017868AE2|nr:hypothetical protein [Pseudomonas sp. PDM14]MBD9481911.1 hypothetical protein [Pseudomonas sp. PDM14]